MCADWEREPLSALAEFWHNLLSNKILGYHVIFGRKKGGLFQKFFKGSKSSFMFPHGLEEIFEFKFLRMLMGVLSPESALTRPSARPPIDMNANV